MVYCGLYPAEGESYDAIRDALEKLQLNDAALTFEPETSVALGFGFRCGFLGLLHLEIMQERLEREFDLDIIATAPGVIYRVTKTDGEVIFVQNPSNLPELLKLLKWKNRLLIQQFTFQVNMLVMLWNYASNVVET